MLGLKNYICVSVLTLCTVGFNVITSGVHAQDSTQEKLDVVTQAGDGVDLDLEDRLRKPVTVRYFHTSLHGVLSDISERHGISIELDDSGLAFAKLKKNAKVTLALSNVPLHRVLELVCEAVAPPGMKMTYEIDGEKVVIPSFKVLTKAKSTERFSIEALIERKKADREALIQNLAMTEEEKEDMIRDINERDIANQILDEIKLLVDPGGKLAEERQISLRVRGKRISAYGLPEHVNRVAEATQALHWLATLNQMKVQDRLETLFSDMAIQRLDTQMDMIVKETEYLGTAVSLIRNRTQSNVFFDWSELNAQGITAKSATLRQASILDAPTRKCLWLALSAIEDGKTNVDYMIDREGVLVISTEEKLRSQWLVYVYDLRQLIETNTLLISEDVDARKIKTDALREIVSVIIGEDQLNNENSKANGGLLLFNNHIIVNTSLERHRQINRIFDVIRTINEASASDATGQSKNYQLTLEALQGHISFESENQTWKKTMLDFQEGSSVYNIFINWAAIERAGLDTQQIMTLKVEDQTMLQVLRALLNIGSDPEKQLLDYFVDQDGVLMISTVEDLSRRKLVKLYDLREMVMNQEKLEKGAQLPAVAIDRLVERIRQQMALEAEATHLRVATRLGESHGLLVVNGAFDSQRKIEKIINLITAESQAEPTEDE